MFFLRRLVFRTLNITPNRRLNTDADERTAFHLFNGNVCISPFLIERRIEYALHTEGLLSFVCIPRISTVIHI